ncbi:DHA2 family methylenomycin A resistance protein-like MFS transporter [Streptomyces sp. V4I8]|uniref:MFS transporter n=1 Tax=Streptomyces sp. V4I8 TaxID=3156469 RepID=UPI003515B2DA
MSVDRRALAACGFGLFLGSANTALTAVALPGLAQEQVLSETMVAWVVIAYQLPVCSTLLMAGALGDRLGHRRVYLAGLSIFAIAATLCALAADPVQLIAARALQGTGGAVLTPLTLAIVVRAHPDPSDRAQAVGAWTATMGAGAVAGPAVGAVAMQIAGWRGPFAVTAVGSVLGFAVAFCWLPDRHERRTAPIAPVSQALLALSLAGALYGLTVWQGASLLWPHLAGAAMVSVGAGLALRFMTSRARHPAFAGHLLGEPAFRSYALFACALFFAFGGFTYYYAIYLGRVADLRPMLIGAYMTPAALAILLAAPVGARLSQRFGGRTVLTGAAAAMALGAVLLSMALSQGPGPSQVLACLVVGAGLGAGNSALNVAVGRTAKATDPGTASAVLAAARMLGGAIGIAVYSSFLTLGYCRALTDDASSKLTKKQLATALTISPSRASADKSISTATAEAFNSGLTLALLGAFAILVLVTAVAYRSIGATLPTKPAQR